MKFVSSLVVWDVSWLDLAHAAVQERFQTISDRVARVKNATRFKVSSGLGRVERCGFWLKLSEQFPLLVHLPALWVKSLGTIAMDDVPTQCHEDAHWRAEHEVGVD